MGDHKLSGGKNFLAGGFGGMCLVFAGHPFDTIKVRLQTMAKSPAALAAAAASTNTANVPNYVGALDCFRRTLSTEGVTGFYKGMGTPILMVTPLFALGFFGFGVGKQIATAVAPAAKKGTAPPPLSPLQLFCAGAFSGCVVSIAATPVERIKCLLQVQVAEGSGSARKYKGPVNCISVLLKEGGVPSLYRGFGATFIRGIPQSGLYFMTYECLKRYILEKEKRTTLTTGYTLLAGGITGIVNWTFCLPFDVVKSRVQTAPPGLYPRGARDALLQLLKTEGPKGLYKGVVPVFLRAFPANAACFMGFETAVKFLNWAVPDF